MTRRTLLALSIAVLPTFCLAANAPEGNAILKATGTEGGLVVHVGCGDGRLTASLRGSESYLVHGLDTDIGQVAAAREHIRSLALYGKVSADTFDGKRLPYVDNLVNLVVAEDLGEVTMAEVMRVLAPNGVAYIGGKKIVKPWPKEIDEWTHYLHGAGNNAVAKDSVVGPPKRYQWVSGPRWARSHDHLNSLSAMVSAKGRIFYIIDEAPIASVAFESEWRLVARDAFSGVLLWKRDIESWEDQFRQFRTGPTGLAKRLVAVDDRVYLTLGYGEPISIIDAATGKTLRTCKSTDNAMEIAVDDGVVYAVVGDRKPFEHEDTGKRAPAGEIHWKITREKAPFKHLVANDAETGKLLWKKDDVDTREIMPSAMAVSEKRVFIQNEKAIVALDAGTGKEIWRSARAVSLDSPGSSSPTLVAVNGVVICADREVGPSKREKDSDGRSVGWYMYPHADWERYKANAPGQAIAYDAVTGEELWRLNCVGNFKAPADIFVVKDTAYVRSYKPGLGVGVDLRTGKVKNPPTKRSPIRNPGGHWRCYRNKATEKYLILCQGRTEFYDLSTRVQTSVNFVRGTCQYGQMPCNGLLYSPHDSCACSIESKLNSLKVLSAIPNPTEDVSGAVRLEKGAAYVGEGEWPHKVTKSYEKGHQWSTYRGDAARSGVAKTKVGAELKEAWKTKLSGKLTAPVVADGLLITAMPDRHAIRALNADTGKPAWSYTAGGMVDSPPTIYNGMAIFGSADGWIYCLRASDGVLAWRYRVARMDRRMVAYGSVESVWPVHGAVLVQDLPAPEQGSRGQAGGIVYAVAGRTTSMDGMYFCALDVVTGKKLVEQRVGRSSFPDILSSDGDNIFMRQIRFNKQGVVQPSNVAHLFSSVGFLDDTWWHRTYWQYGTGITGMGYTGWFAAGERRNSGRLMVKDGLKLYGFGRRNQYDYMGAHVGLGKMKYQLYAADLHEPAKHPHYIAIDLADTVMIDGFTYLPRQDGRDGGVIYEYEFFVSQDGKQWGKPVIKSYFGNIQNSPEQQIVRVDKPVKGRCIKLVSKSAIGGHPFAGAAEIGVRGNIVGELASVSSDTKATSLAKNRWKILSFSSEARYHRNLSAVQAIDDNPDTFWHTEWATAAGHSNLAWNQKKPDLPSRWKSKIELLARGMVLSGKILFVAGPPDLFGTAPGDNPHVYDLSSSKSLQAQREALAGKKGSILWAVSAETGEKLSEYRFEDQPAWDGLIASNKRLYMTMEDGTVICMKEK